MNHLEKRAIESFEHKTSYYKQSYINGNKTHVKEELSELFYSHPVVAMKILIDLPKDIASAVVDSEQMKNAQLCMNLDSFNRKK